MEIQSLKGARERRLLLDVNVLLTKNQEAMVSSVKPTKRLAGDMLASNVYQNPEACTNLSIDHLVSFTRSKWVH